MIAKVYTIQLPVVLHQKIHATVQVPFYMQLSVENSDVIFPKI